MEQVSKIDASDLTSQLEGELFDKWHERCEVMTARNISIKNIDGFLNHLKRAYEGKISITYLQKKIVHRENLYDKFNILRKYKKNNKITKFKNVDTLL